MAQTLTPDQVRILTMYEWYDPETREVTRQPDHITDDGLLVYYVQDEDPAVERTVIVVYPKGHAATFTTGMNLPKGVSPEWPSH